jgi:hypothetical protein
MQQWTYLCPACGHTEECPGAWPCHVFTKKPERCGCCGSPLHDIDCAVKPNKPAAETIDLLDCAGMQATGEVVDVRGTKLPGDSTFSATYVKVRSDTGTYYRARVSPKLWSKLSCGSRITLIGREAKVIRHKEDGE